MTAPIAAIVLAGSRPGPDPLLTGTNVSTKALLPVAGQAMLVHVVSALRASPLVGPITILAQNSAELAVEPGLAGLADLHFSDSDSGTSQETLTSLNTHPWRGRQQETILKLVLTGTDGKLQQP